MKIGYARTSTSKQALSLDAQRELLQQAGCAPKRIYTDQISGATWRRAGLQAALDYARPEDTLVVTRLDRLGRSLREMINLIAELADKGVHVQVLDPALDTSREADKVVIHVLASLADWERQIIVERTKQGVAHARQQGRMPGRKPKLTKDQARQVQRLIAQGERVTDIARSFNVSRQTVYRTIERASGDVS